MKALLTAILVPTALCGILTATSPTVTQDASAASQGQPSAQLSPGGENKPQIRIAPGSIIPVELTRSIDAKKVKPGDEVEAKVIQDLRADDGELILPKDTKVLGHVTQAQTRSKQEKESRLVLAFDRASLKNGEAIPLPMSIQAVIAPPSLNSENGMPVANSGPPSSTQSGGGGRSPGMSGGGISPVPAPPANNDGSSNLPSAGATRPAITAKTQGVVGISHLNLSPSPDKAQGSILSSEKNNVKLESGTVMLLRVNADPR